MPCALPWLLLLKYSLKGRKPLRLYGKEKGEINKNEDNFTGPTSAKPFRAFNEKIIFLWLWPNPLVAWQHIIKEYVFRSALQAGHYQMKLLEQQMSSSCKWDGRGQKKKKKEKKKRGLSSKKELNSTEMLLASSCCVPVILVKRRDNFKIFRERGLQFINESQGRRDLFPMVEEIAPNPCALKVLQAQSCRCVGIDRSIRHSANKWTYLCSPHYASSSS